MSPYHCPITHLWYFLRLFQFQNNQDSIIIFCLNVKSFAARWCCSKLLILSKFLFFNSVGLHAYNIVHEALKRPHTHSVSKLTPHCSHTQVFA